MWQGLQCGAPSAGIQIVALPQLALRAVSSCQGKSSHVKSVGVQRRLELLHLVEALHPLDLLIEESLNNGPSDCLDAHLRVEGEGEV